MKHKIPDYLQTLVKAGWGLSIYIDGILKNHGAKITYRLEVNFRSEGDKENWFAQLTFTSQIGEFRSVKIKFSGLSNNGKNCYLRFDHGKNKFFGSKEVLVENLEKTDVLDLIAQFLMEENVEVHTQKSRNDFLRILYNFMEAKGE